MQWRNTVKYSPQTRLDFTSAFSRPLVRGPQLWLYLSLRFLSFATLAGISLDLGLVQLW